MRKLPTDFSSMPKMKIVVIGDGGVGKSAIILQFMQKIFVENHDPTIECTYYKNFEVDGEWSNLEVQDTAGQEEFASMRESYYRAANGFLIVFSITTKESFDMVRRFYQSALRIRDRDHFPMLLVANKMDLEASRKVMVSEIEELSKELQVEFIETSAKDPPVNIDDAFSQIVRKIRSHQQTNDVKAKSRPRQKQKCCLL